jgi:hypothetical protein
MPNCMPADFWPAILAYVLPPLGALLSATALWVAAHAASISKDAQSISRAVADSSNTLPDSFERRASHTCTDTPSKS